MVEIKEITTKTCGVCKMLKPALEKIMKEFEGKATLTVYDAEDEEVKKVIKEYGISQVPAFFFYKDGNMIDKHFGPINPLQIRKMLLVLI